MSYDALMAGQPATQRGRATRERIVAGAAALIAERGAAGTGLDEIRARTRTSKSQLYHYFADKDALVRAVVEFQSATVLEWQAQALGAVEDWQGLERWADAIVNAAEVVGLRGGCPIGTLAADLADTDDTARTMLSAAFSIWCEKIRSALSRLREQNLLEPGADLDVLTVRTLAAVQGGLLLAKTTRNSTPLRVALDGAVDSLRAHAGAPGGACPDREPHPRGVREPPTQSRRTGSD
jgi:TetR/AcrR family transcriptional regulator, transcriptional repressor for nem operon